MTPAFDDFRVRIALIGLVGNAADRFRLVQFHCLYGAEWSPIMNCGKVNQVSLRRHLVTNSNFRVAVVPKFDVEIRWPLQLFLCLSLYSNFERRFWFASSDFGEFYAGRYH